MGRGTELLAALAAFAMPGCYSGVSSFADGATDGAGSGADSSDDGASDDGEASELCDTASVGVSPLRRLTRSQYDNTVRDLLGITGNPSAQLAPDEKVGPFYSNGTAPVTELLAEQYMRVAEDLATTAATDLGALVPCDPAVDDQVACGADFVDTFGMRAFRRPLTAEERTALVGLFESAYAAEGFTGGIELVIQAVLQSPQFLYHLELGMPAAGDDVVALDHYELASRLSYFLWDSMPDDALLQAAGDGELDTPEALRAQAERMLGDPRAAAAIASFHRQWLHLDGLGNLEKNQEAYPAFSIALRDAMADETTRFADWVIRSDDGRLETLLTASYSFLDGPLFELYGVTPPADHDPSMPVQLDPTQRAGLLTHASVLATHAHADQSSPVHRGKLVRENFLCTPLAPPPPEVDVVPPPLDPNATTRERFDQHRSDPACAGCHNLIDPLGFGFEHYDGIGAWRATDVGKDVDASGEVVGTEDINGPFDGAPELAQLLASSEQVRTCVAEQWFSFGFGREPAQDDACSFDAMAVAFAESDHDIRELLLTMITTDSFRHRRLEEASP
jgi:Protein of unknown function (DUF1592)/Protein of unknown function (DUF1588)/Protein of unknown function (DUF1595)/Protein of unknown function (DUF1587)/Protein of unknown function (DUF1585)